MKLSDKLLIVVPVIGLYTVAVAGKIDPLIVQLLGGTPLQPSYYTIQTACEAFLFFLGTFMMYGVMKYEEMLNDLERERKKILIREKIIPIPRSKKQRQEYEEAEKQGAFRI